MHIPNFKGVSGSEDSFGGDNSTQFINIGRVTDKSFKEYRRKMGGGGGGGRMGDNNVFDFFMLLARQKNATLKNCILGKFFYSYL